MGTLQQAGQQHRWGDPPDGIRGLGLDLHAQALFGADRVEQCLRLLGVGHDRRGRAGHAHGLGAGLPDVACAVHDVGEAAVVGLMGAHFGHLRLHLVELNAFLRNGEAVVLGDRPDLLGQVALILLISTMFIAMR